MKFKLIKERIPEKSFKFPGKEYKDRKRKDGTYMRYCNREWLTEFSFLSYSKVKDGLYCLSCVLFLTGSSTQHAHLLISAPYRNWKDARADMLKHSTLQYHMNADCMRLSFIASQEGSQIRVDQSVTSNAQNRAIIKSIISCLEFQIKGISRLSFSCELMQETLIWIGISKPVQSEQHICLKPHKTSCFSAYERSFKLK